MKKITVLVIFTFLFNSLSFSQLFPKNEKKEYIYGKMVNKKKELTGYFWFDNKNITTNGQTVYYLKTMETTYVKTFQSRKYDYFVSDSLYLETFDAIPLIGGDIIIMIPRIIDGEIQLFGLNFTKYNFYFLKSTKDYYFIKTGTAKMRISKKQFKEQMKDLIGKDKVLLNKINSGELTYDNLPEIIQSYNQNNN